MYVTIYTVTRKSRKHGELVTEGCAYKTKSLTPVHQRIRERYPDSQTWENPRSVITEFVPGMNLGMRPIVRGGTRIDG
jgi:hypothetical protein